MVRIYGVIVSNLPPTIESFALQLFFSRYGLPPYEVQIRSHVTCPGTESLDVREACVHFLRKSDKKRAITIASGVKFGNNRIMVESCGCEDSFFGAKGSKSGENMTKASGTPRNHSKELSAVEITAAVIRQDDNTGGENEVAKNKNRMNSKSHDKHDISTPLHDSRRTCADPASTKSNPPTKNATKIHGVKVANLHYASTTEEVKEHFQSRNFKVAEVAVHTRNEHDTAACVHFRSEKEQREAIRKTDGSLLYGREITVRPCCCKRTLREKGYGKRPSRNAPSGSANEATQGSRSHGKCTPPTVSTSGSSGIDDARSGLRMKAKASKARSKISLPNSEAPTCKATPPSTVKPANSEAPTVNVTPPSTVEVVRTEAPTV